MQPVSDHIYFREFDPLRQDSLTKLAPRIAPGSMVLDLGCGPGVLGAHLSERGCVVDGIEGNPSAAEIAATKLRRVVVADLDHEPVAPPVGEQRYDYIVCADVLEHLRRPEALLAQLPALLTPSGRILLSIPNVAYAGLVGALINGEFRYRPEGLLDATHLRFFTRRSLEALVEQCGLQVVHTDAVTMPINESEFAADAVEALPPAVLRTLLAQRDALTYQFIIELVRKDHSATEQTSTQVDQVAFSFAAQLHYRSDRAFDDAHACTVRGAMGIERQTLRFTLPPSPSGFSALRLDPANRPGYLRIFTMALSTDQGECVWRWQPTQKLDQVRASEVQVLVDGDAALLVLGGDDPWLELPIAEGTLRALCGGGTLTVEVAWPQAPETFALLRRLFTLREELDAAREELRAERAALAAVQSSLTWRIARPLHAILGRLRRGR